MLNKYCFMDEDGIISTCYTLQIFIFYHWYRETNMENAVVRESGKI